MYTSITYNNQSEQIKTILFPYIETIKNSIQHSSLLYWEEKIQFIFTNLNHIDFEWNTQTLDQSNEHATPIRKIPYQKEHFALEEGKLIIVDDTINTLLSPVTWKCPAVWVVHSKNDNWSIEKKQIITFLLEEIAHSYLFTATNTVDMMQQEQLPADVLHLTRWVKILVLLFEDFRWVVLS